MSTPNHKLDFKEIVQDMKLVHHVIKSAITDPNNPEYNLERLFKRKGHDMVNAIMYLEHVQKSLAVYKIQTKYELSYIDLNDVTTTLIDSEFDNCINEFFIHNPRENVFDNLSDFKLVKIEFIEVSSRIFNNKGFIPGTINKEEIEKKFIDISEEILYAGKNCINFLKSNSQYNGLKNKIEL